MSIISEKIQRLYNFLAGTAARSGEVNDELNQIIDSINDAVDDLDSVSTLAETNAENIIDISGEGRTTQTIKGNNDLINDHMDNKNNPHEVTPQQLDVYTKTELLPYLVSSDTEIRYEVFTIISDDNNDGTFTYTDGENIIEGELTPEGYQKFVLKNGMYKVGADRIEAFINDTLHRSAASGGLIEVGSDNTDSFEIILSSPVSTNSEVTFRYFERIGLAGKHGIAHSPGGTDEIIYIGSDEPEAVHPGKIRFKIL